MNAVEIVAPAKVNLWLHVLARETSGFHSLESLFCAIALADTIRVERGGADIELEVRGEIATGPADRNLAVRAARRFLEEIGPSSDGLRITIEKRIPAAAGLGGGSSDAAATLRALNSLYGEPLAEETLLQLGIELGSDVPFFLCGSALALGWSRGERLLALPSLPRVPLLVAHPGEAMPTGAAFEGIARARGEYRPHAARIELRELTTWPAVAARSENHFQPVACEAIPRLHDAIRVLRDAGALIALLAGSGASVFGVFQETRTMEPAAEALRRLDFDVWRTTTLSALPEPASPAGGTG